MDNRRHFYPRRSSLSERVACGGNMAKQEQEVILEQHGGRDNTHIVPRRERKGKKVTCRMLCDNALPKAKRPTD